MAISWRIHAPGVLEKRHDDAGKWQPVYLFGDSESDLLPYHSPDLPEPKAPPPTPNPDQEMENDPAIYHTEKSPEKMLMAEGDSRPSANPCEPPLAARKLLAEPPAPPEPPQYFLEIPEPSVVLRQPSPEF